MPASFQVKPVHTFSRRALGRSVVIGDYLYLDGGEYAFIGDEVSRPLQTTLSIPLHTSWTNSTVKIRSISNHPAPLLDELTLWADDNCDAFHQWGGVHFTNDEPQIKPLNAFWKFMTDGLGGGKWIKAKPPASNFVRTDQALVATGNGNGYAVGGIPTGQGNTWTYDALGPAPIDQMVIFNIRNNTWSWTNVSDVDGPGRTSAGVAHFATTFGTDGVLLTMGGLGVSTTTNKLDMVQFDKINIFDPTKQQWHVQALKGHLPEPRMHACSVGLQGPDGTYQIYIYGGSDRTNGATFNDMYLLTLPGFIWHRVGEVPGDLRTLATCQVVGRRQMLVVGGLNWSLGFPKDFLDTDPNTQGLAIFDLTELQWKSSYDANASAYDTPQPVKDIYSNVVSSTHWSSDAVRNLFKDNFPPQPQTTQSTSDPSRPGIIAAGIVTGIVLVTIIVGAFFFIRFRRRKRHIRFLQSKSSTEIFSELPDAPISASYSRPRFPYDVQKTRSIGLGVEIREFEPYRQLYQAYRPKAMEIDGKDVGRVELRGVKSPVELDGRGRNWAKE